jgi:hypothetical protein
MSSVEAQKLQADPYHAKAKEQLGIPLDAQRESDTIYPSTKVALIIPSATKTQRRKIKTVAGDIRKKENAEKLNQLHDAFIQQGFDAGRDAVSQCTYCLNLI